MPGPISDTYDGPSDREPPKAPTTEELHHQQIIDQKDWYEYNDCTHAHCVYGCEHPQPFIYRGVFYCGRCWHKEERMTIMMPCDKTTCPDDK